MDLNLQSIINENKEIESKDLENGINLMSKQNINNQWSKKYDFNFVIYILIWILVKIWILLKYYILYGMVYVLYV